MFDEYLQADEDEDDAAPKLSLQASGDAAPEADAEQESRQRQGERHEADDAHGGQDGRHALHAQEGERNAHGQGVDACGHGQHEDDPQAGGVEVVAALFFLERFAHHAPAQKGQDAEGYPVVHVLDEVAECACAGPSDERHQRLEQSEEEGHRQHGAPEGALQQDAACDGDGEAVHGKSHGQKPDFNLSHFLSLKKGNVYVMV